MVHRPRGNSLTPDQAAPHPAAADPFQTRPGDLQPADAQPSGPDPTEITRSGTGPSTIAPSAATRKASPETNELIEELRRTLGRLEAALATISDALVITDRTGQLLWCNQTFERLVRRSRLFLVGRTITSVLPRDADDQPLLSDLLFAEEGAGSLRAVLCHNPLQAVVIEWRPVLSEPQQPLVFCIRDISADLSNEAMRLEVERIAQERLHLETRVLTCAVTGLPNRLALEQRLELVFRRQREQPGWISLLFCDLNGFKQINDLHGHAAGDAMLVTVGQRLQAALRSDDFVARLAGDEFVVVSAGPATPLEAINLAVRLLEELGRPWSLEGRILHPSMSVGIAMTDDPDLGGEELLHRADLAMYEAKTRPGLPVSLHNPAVADQAGARLELTSRLQQAIALNQPEREGLRILYRPIIALADGALVGHEATLQLEPPGQTSVPIPELLAIVERSGLGPPLGRWVRSTAIAQLQQWSTEAAAPLLACDISASELAGKGLRSSLTSQISASGLDPGHLVMELAEPLLLNPSAALIAELSALRELGVRIVLDHFGSGPSNLADLCDLPLDAIKFDCQLLQERSRGRRLDLLQTAVRLARDLDLAVIADGIVAEEQRQALQALGVLWGQGPLFGPPRC